MNVASEIRMAFGHASKRQQSDNRTANSHQFGDCRWLNHIMIQKMTKMNIVRFAIIYQYFFHYQKDTQ